MEKRVNRANIVTARIAPEKGRQMKIFTARWGLGSGTVLRRLIKLVIAGQIRLLDLLRLMDMEDEEGTSEKSVRKVKSICARLSEEENAEFCAIVTNWDFSPGTLARLLVQYFLELKDKESVWGELTPGVPRCAPKGKTIRRNRENC
jgi:hypothetical protein